MTTTHPAFTSLPAVTIARETLPALSPHLGLVGRFFCVSAPYSVNRGLVIVVREACCQQLRVARVVEQAYGWGVWVHVQELDGAVELTAADFPEGVAPCPAS